RVGAFGVAEIFRYRQSRERHAQTRARRLGHLAIDQRGLRVRWIAGLDHARLRHFQPEVVTLARALADAGEHGEAAVIFGDVVDQLHDDDGLAHARAAEQSDLAALQEGLNQIDDLHAGLKHFRARGLLVESGCETVNRHSLLVLDRTELIDGFADYVHHATERAVAHRHRDRPALVDGFHAAHHAVGRLHGDAAHAALAEMLLHLENHVDRIRHVEAVGYD